MSKGDLLLVRIEALPEGVLAPAAEEGRYVVANSETGHHHTVNASMSRFYADPKDARVCYLQVTGPEGVNLVHHRSFGTHEGLHIWPGVYKVHRQ